MTTIRPYWKTPWPPRGRYGTGLGVGDGVAVGVADRSAATGSGVVEAAQAVLRQSRSAARDRRSTRER
jgi:hypothetical protein